MENKENNNGKLASDKQYNTVVDITKNNYSFFDNVDDGSSDNDDDVVIIDSDVDAHLNSNSTLELNNTVTSSNNISNHINSNNNNFSTDIFDHVDKKVESNNNISTESNNTNNAVETENNAVETEENLSLVPDIEIDSDLESEEDFVFIEGNSNDPLSALDKQYLSSVGTDISSISKSVVTQQTEVVEEEPIIDNEAETTDEDNWLSGSQKAKTDDEDNGTKTKTALEEEKTKKIEKLKESLGENNPTVVTEEIQNNPSNLAKTSLLSTLFPNGHVNKRFVAVIGCGLLLVVVFLVNNSAKPTNKQNNRGLLPPEEARNVGKENIDTAELTPARSRYSPKEEEAPKTTSESPVTIPTTLPPVTVPPVVAPLPTPKAETPEEKKEFGLELRAGTAAALKTITPAKPEEDNKGQDILLEGLSMQMMLLEPFRSGISTFVKAQIIAEVRNAKGDLIIPVGSRVQVPFERFEVDGRVVNDSQQAALILLPNGKKLTAKGLVKGVDGFAGIKGNLKKLSKGNIFARMGKTVTRIGSRVVGIETGGLAGRGLEDTINETVDSNSQYISTGRTVELLPGTRFTFNVN